MVRATIFDLDGVVVDTAKYHYMAWRRLADELGFVFTELDNERLKGVSRMTSLDILLSVGSMQDRFTAEDKERMAARKNEWYLELVSAMTPDEVLPGVVDFLMEIRESGVKTALGSASKNAALILERVGIAALFDVVVDGRMVARAKPDPEVFLKGAELLDVDAAECVVFEDAEAGIEAALRGGMYAVGVGSPDVLSKANRVIPGFDKLHWYNIEFEIYGK